MWNFSTFRELEKKRTVVYVDIREGRWIPTGEGVVVLSTFATLNDEIVPTTESIWLR